MRSLKVWAERKFFRLHFRTIFVLIDTDISSFTIFLFYFWLLTNFDLFAQLF